MELTVFVCIVFVLGCEVRAPQFWLTALQAEVLALRTRNSAAGSGFVSGGRFSGELRLALKVFYMGLRPTDAVESLAAIRGLRVGELEVARRDFRGPAEQSPVGQG